MSNTATEAFIKRIQRRWELEETKKINRSKLRDIRDWLKRRCKNGNTK